MASTAEVLAIINVVERVGVPVVRNFISSSQKKEITSEDWDELVDKFSKTPEDYLKEAEEKFGK
jgi:hypothetical protein